VINANVVKSAPTWVLILLNMPEVSLRYGRFHQMCPAPTGFACTGFFSGAAMSLQRRFGDNSHPDRGDDGPLLKGDNDYRQIAPAVLDASGIPTNIVSHSLSRLVTHTGRQGPRDVTYAAASKS
jgi:hypothetical protein